MMENQKLMILNHLKRDKSITALEALSKFNCFRLASRIADLRKEGIQISTNRIKLDNGKVIAKYILP